MTFANVGLDRLANVLFATFLHCEVTLFSSFHAVLLGGNSLCGACFIEKSILLHLFEVDSTKLFRILHWRLAFSLPFIFLFNYSFISV